MEPFQSKPRTSAKDFFLNLGAIVALYTTVFSLIHLLFTVINRAFPQIGINNYYNYSTPSISFPVATLIIFFPIYVLLTWLLEKSYSTEPEKRQLSVRRWLTYITLFIAGLALAGDLVTVLYYFIDGQELTAGFLLKILAVLVVTLAVFMFYISDIRSKLNTFSRRIWAVVAGVIILASIVWGFAVLGSPRTQQLLKYDQQRLSDLQSLNYQVQDYYNIHTSLPEKISDMYVNNYAPLRNDPQTGQPYEYVLVGQSAKAYQLCATFNKASDDKNLSYANQYIYGENISWSHPAGRYCFSLSIPVSMYKPVSAVPIR